MRGCAGGDRGRRPGRGDPDRGRRAGAGGRAADRRQGARDRAGRRAGHRCPSTTSSRRASRWRRSTGSAHEAGRRRDRRWRRAGARVRKRTPRREAPFGRVAAKERKAAREAPDEAAAHQGAFPAWGCDSGRRQGRAALARGRFATLTPARIAKEGEGGDGALDPGRGGGGDRGSARDWTASGVSIDTRSLARGDLFVALSAARDGHDFVAEALAKGAAAALVARRPEGVAADAPLLVVPDVLAGAAARSAAAARARFGGRVVAVTGSVGKTGSRRCCGAALGRAGDGACGGEELQQPLGRAADAGADAGGPRLRGASRSG